MARLILGIDRDVALPTVPLLGQCQLVGIDLHSKPRAGWHLHSPARRVRDRAILDHVAGLLVHMGVEGMRKSGNGRGEMEIGRCRYAEFTATV